MGSDFLLWIVFRAMVSEDLLPCALGIEEIVATGDREDFQLLNGLVAGESDIVVEKLPPRSEEHRKIELVGDDNVSFQFR